MEGGMGGYVWFRANYKRPKHPYNRWSIHNSTQANRVLSNHCNQSLPHSVCGQRYQLLLPNEQSLPGRRHQLILPNEQTYLLSSWLRICAQRTSGQAAIMNARKTIKRPANDTLFFVWSGLQRQRKGYICSLPHHSSLSRPFIKRSNGLWIPTIYSK